MRSAAVIRVLSWKAEARSRYVIFAFAVLPFPASRSAPVVGSTTSASSGIATPAFASVVVLDGTARFATQLPLYGAARRAGSPRAAQSRRPAGSEKPAIGFHAAAGFVAIPRRSHPFHGKSLSLTVRMKIGAFMPSSESHATFSTPCENSAL
jgi:hypothetical protein